MQTVFSKSEGIMGKLLFGEKTEFTKEEFDEKGHIKASGLLHHFERIASDHADALGYGSDVLIKKNWIWVLSKVKYTMHGNIREGETYDIFTYPIPDRGTLYPRGYYITGEDGKLAAAAMSQWCIVNFRTRKLEKTALKMDGEYIDPPAFQEKIEKIRCRDMTEAGVYVAEAEDIDINRHVNNSRYADIVSHITGRNDYKSFTINFHKETFPGDKICLFRGDVKDPAAGCGAGIVVDGRLEDGTDVFRAKVIY